MFRNEAASGFLPNFSSNQWTKDLICFSHLRWNFVYQRPQHIISRAAKYRRVFFFEEPVFHEDASVLDVTDVGGGVTVVVPKLNKGLTPWDIVSFQRWFLNQLISDFEIVNFIAWYYTPMALKFSRHIHPDACVYDCMDQLSHFKDAPQELEVLESELFRRADVVFTGGRSLYEAKMKLHKNVHAFPSSVDVSHFAKARTSFSNPTDQEKIKNPRIGYIGVIDERIDLDLVKAMAEMRPEWQFIFVGPIVKIDESSLPRLPNIYYLGSKKYEELPTYLASWNATMMPFALNDATEFISPTKTPEYLSAGKKVVSTPIRDVVSPYGDEGFVMIADTPEKFVACMEQALAEPVGELWQNRVDRFLLNSSWDKTFDGMWKLVIEACKVSNEKKRAGNYSVLPLMPSFKSKASYVTHA